MKIISSSLSIFILLIFSVFSLNAQNSWNRLEKINYNYSQKQVYVKKNMPQEFELYAFDIASFMKPVALKSPHQRIIQIPNAAGTLTKFKIYESSNFEQKLQDKFPEITSFSGQGLDDPTATVKISIGADGLHATIFSAKHETVYIDPYTKDHKTLMVYKRNSLLPADQDFKCQVEEAAKNDWSFSSVAKTTNDGKLRTFRLALVCSGEYAQFHLGANQQNIPATATDAEKKAAVLSAMNTSMTRINGVFEKDLAVKMVLVGDNDKLIFLDSETDGITDGSPVTMLSETQSKCDALIGNTNYDIGHIFSIGGDGIAGLGVVCVTGQKARGVTGRSQPVGDPYDIDFVAHEMGHQFGATHTQNNDCNRTNSTAVEPGSGSTIMSYAGICSPNVIGVGASTGNSDDYFHSVNITQMLATIQSSANCAALTNTGNFAPIANAGVDRVIPVSTPFKLEGIATDANGTSSLTYNWEQIDNEIGLMPPLSSNSGGPIFRSLPSKEVPARYFPDLGVLINGNNSTWEVLPSVARELNFSFLVRDNHSGGGSTARDDVKITVVNSQSFAVTAPNTALTWDTGTTQTITWQKGATDLLPINCQAVNIKLSLDGGATYPVTLKENTPNDGSESIIVPDTPSTLARIMVEAADNIFFNVNASNFTINSSDPTFIMSDISGVQSACNTSNETVTFTIGFDFINGFSENVSLSAIGYPLGANISFSQNTINADGTVNMTLSNFNNVTPVDYQLTIRGASTSLTQELNVTFRLLSNSFNAMTLTSPSDGAQNVVLNPQFQWNAQSNAISYDIEIATDANFNNLILTDNVATNFYEASNLNSSTTYYWRVKPKNQCGEGTFSSSFSFDTEACKVCNSFGDTTYETSTTLVNFNTLSNASGKPSGYSDYTAISTAVKTKQSYDLRVHVNTDGNFRVQTKVWIDWNQNCSFDDAGEEYDLGAALDTPNGETSFSPLSITIPADAILGNTVMRVSSRYTDPSPISYPTSCMEDFDGEVEDYTIIVESATASIEDVAFSNFNLFPNPTNGTFKLYFDAAVSENIKLQLYDIRGRMIEEKNFKNNSTYFSEKIEFNQLSSGMYLLKIKNGTKQTTRKLIVE